MSSLDLSSFVSITDLPEDVGFSTFFWHLFSKRLYTDVIFGLRSHDEDITFQAHKLVLAIRSSYFAKMFFGEEKNSDNVIQLTDINPEAFEAMLKFLYDYIPEIKTPKKACEIYKVASRFKITSLMNLCCQTLNRVEIVPSNAFDMMDASDYLQNKSTRDRCLKLIQERTKEVMESYELSQISPSWVHILLDSSQLSLGSKLELFEWIFAWAKNQYIEKPEFGSTREALEEFLPKLSFLSLSSAEFTQLYRSHEDVFTTDEALAIFMNIGIRGSRAMPNWYVENID